MNSGRKAGFTLVEIMIVVTIIGMLAAITIPVLGRARDRSRQQSCVNNLRLIQSAKQQWATENAEDESSAPIPAELDPYLRGGTAKTICPADSQRTFDTSYALLRVANDPQCKIYPTKHVWK